MAETYNDAPRSHAHAAAFGTNKTLNVMVLSESPAHVGLTAVAAATIVLGLHLCKCDKCPTQYYSGQVISLQR